MKKILIFTVFLAVLSSSCRNSSILILSGEIENNTISVCSTVSGKIVEMNKKQGEAVKKGDIIAVIDPTNQKYIVEQLEAVVDMKTAKLDELKTGTRKEQIEQAEAQVRAAKGQLDLLVSGNRQEQIEQARNNMWAAQEGYNAAKTSYDYLNSEYAKALKLNTEGALSKSELDNLKYKLDTAEKQLASAEYQLGASKKQLELLENGSTSLSIDIARANYDVANAQLKLLEAGPTVQSINLAQSDLNQSIAQLNQAKNVLSNHSIVSLTDGVIISKDYELGDVVNIGSNIADISVSNDLYVVCYIPNEYLDKVYYGQSLRVITSIGEQIGTISYINLKDEYVPNDEKSTSHGDSIATKIKVAVKDSKGILKPNMRAKVEIPLK